jgi:hypothetical protein
MALMENIVGGFAGSWGVITKVATTLMWVGLAGVLVVIFLYVVKFKHPLLLIFETSGGGKRIVRDRGYFDKKKNTFFALKSKNVDFPVPESSHEYLKGSKVEYIATVRNNSASFLTITPNPHFIPADYDMLEKLALKFNNQWSIFQPKQNFWDKYGASILWVGSMGVFLIVIILILKRMDAIISLGNNAAMAQVAASKQVIQSLPIFMLWRIKKDGTK